MAEFSKGDPYFVPNTTLRTVVNGSDVAVCYVAENIDTEWLLNLLNDESGQRERADRADKRVEDLELHNKALVEDDARLIERCEEYEREIKAYVRQDDELWRKHRKAKRRLAAEKTLTAALLKARGVK